MKKLKDLHIGIRTIIVLTTIAFSIVVFPIVTALGWVLLFAGLFVLFETFGFNLFVKIIFALVIGVALPFSGLVDASILVDMKPVGSKIFMHLLTMALVPLVFSSILTGVVSLGDIKRLNRVGAKTIGYYLLTTAVAISIGLGLANLFKPGKNISAELRNQFSTSYEATAQSKVKSAEASKKTAFQTMQSIFPKNILASVSGPKPQMLALIFFAIISGLALLKMEHSVAEPVVKFFVGITEMTVQLVIMAMRVAPYGVFAIIGATIAKTQSSELILALIPFSMIVLLGLFIHLFGTSSVSLAVFSKRPVIETFKKMKEVLITAFSTASSGATMPFTLKTTEKDLKVSKEISGFVIPLGATINMDGTALFQGVSALFLANIYGIDLGLGDQLTVVGMAVLASIGTAAVPGVGVVILTMILVSVNIPPEGILFVLPVNNILDMFRTSVNVAGDMCCAIYVDSREKAEV